MPQDILKIAAKRDLVRAVGSEVLTTGIIGGLGAAGILSGGATGGAGFLATLGLGSNPIGWIIGGTLAVGSLVYAIHQATSLTDDNIEDLITRIEALDYEDTNAKGIVENWIATLEGHKKDLQLPLTATNPTEKAKWYGKKVGELEKGLTFLRAMQDDWTQVKPHMGDWNVLLKDDIQDFEVALPRVIATYEKQLQYVKGVAQQSVTNLVDELKETKELILSINKLDAEITRLYGKPEYEKHEQPLLDYMKRVMAVPPQTNYTEMEQSKAKLTTLRNELNQLLQQVKRQKKSSLFISKRAVKLPSAPTAAPAGGMRGQKKRRRGVSYNAEVERLQQQINDISVSQKIRNVWLEEDGRYGNNTARALHTLVKAVPELEKAMLARGVNADMVLDVRRMNRYKRHMYIASTYTRALYNQLLSKKRQQPLSQREKSLGPPDQPAPPSPPGQLGRRPTRKPSVSPEEYGERGYTGRGAVCNWRKENPTPGEIIACLNKLHAQVAGERVNLYDYMLGKGMNDDNMVAMINFLFGGARSQDWDPYMIVRAVGSRYSIL